MQAQSFKKGHDHRAKRVAAFIKKDNKDLLLKIKGVKDNIMPDMRHDLAQIILPSFRAA